MACKGILIDFEQNTMIKSNRIKGVKSMTFLISSVYTFLYVAVIIMGGITLTLTLLLKIREKNKKHRVVFIFICSVFIFMILDFITYYFLLEFSSGILVFILITMSDTFFCVLTTAWVYAIIVLTNAENIIRIKTVCIISAVYLVLSQILSVLEGRYDTYALHMKHAAGKVMLQALNAGYVCFIIAVSIMCIYLIIKRYQKGMKRTLILMMALLLVGYMLWIAYWDYSTWYKSEDNLMEIYGGDPLILMYAVFNAAAIYFFYKKDLLKIRSAQVAADEAVDIISERYELSGREREVLMLLNKGFSNPQIAGELFISENTVKRHVSNIFRKTETQNRHEIIVKISNLK